jgi:hypothetical protein
VRQRLKEGAGPVWEPAKVRRVYENEKIMTVEHLGVSC